MTFEQYLLENGMNNPAALSPEDLARWRARYVLNFPPEKPEPKPATDAPAPKP